MKPTPMRVSKQSPPLAHAPTLPAAAAVMLLLLAPSGVLAAPPLPDLPPWLAHPGARPFSTVVCPFAPPHTDPVRPLEVCNVRATARTGPANEVDLALDPADPHHLVVVAKSYNYTRLLNSSLRGGVVTAHAASFDGGRTWHEGYLQPLEPVLTLPDGTPLGETPDHETDPVVEFAPDGSVLAMTVNADHQVGLPVYRSVDGGRSFARIATAAPQLTDKEWLVSDPFSGNVYGAALVAEDVVGFFRSEDGGFTWSAPVAVLGGVGATLDVGPGGILYLAASHEGVVNFTRSLDRGTTWEPARAIAPRAPDFLSGACGRLFRTPNFAQLASSRTTGAVEVAFVQRGTAIPDPEGCPEAPDTGIFVVRSDDSGLTWSAPHRVDDGVPAFRFMPAIAMSPRGDVHVSWLDQRSDPGGQFAEVYYAHSAHGLAFDRNLKVSDVPFWTTLSHHQEPNPLNPLFSEWLTFVGDYMGLAATDDTAWLAFADTRYGRSDVFVASVR